LELQSENAQQPPSLTCWTPLPAWFGSDELMVGSGGRAPPQRDKKRSGLAVRHRDIGVERKRYRDQRQEKYCA
jgi:hypothetical protein